MEIEFVAPQSTGEMLAWFVTVITMLVGLALMIIPRRFAHVLGMATRILGMATRNSAGTSEIRRAFGGSWVGIALGALLFAQPLIYLALGLGFVFMVIGRIVSFIADGSLNGQTVAATAIEAAGAFFLLAYPLQFIP